MALPFSLIVKQEAGSRKERIAAQGLDGLQIRVGPVCGGGNSAAVCCAGRTAEEEREG
jgi:hypothetical protein